MLESSCGGQPAAARDPAHPLHRWRNNNPPLWTGEEDRTLQVAYGVLPPDDLAARLPGRSRNAIKARARKLGLRAYLPNPKARQHVAYSVSRIGKMLGVNDYTVRRWVAAGVLPCYRAAIRAGRHRVSRVDSEELATFLDRYRHLYDAALIVDPSWRRLVAALPPARERWYTPKEAGRLLGRTHHTVRGLIRSGDLAAQQICGRYWVSETAMRAYVPVVPDGRPTREAIRERRRPTLAGREGAARPYGRRHVTGPLDPPPPLPVRTRPSGTS